VLSQLGLTHDYRLIASNCGATVSSQLSLRNIDIKTAECTDITNTCIEEREVEARPKVQKRRIFNPLRHHLIKKVDGLLLELLSVPRERPHFSLIRFPE
jgi:hypothetical protein